MTRPTSRPGRRRPRDERPERRPGAGSLVGSIMATIISSPADDEEPELERGADAGRRVVVEVAAVG